MSSWASDELQQIAAQDDLHVAPLRDDGVTYGTPTWIWSVAVDDFLYVRAYNGTRSRWHQAAIRQRFGRIFAAGKTKDVCFQSAAGPINDRIDEAYRSKYAASPYLRAMTGARARAATVRIAPRAVDG